MSKITTIVKIYEVDHKSKESLIIEKLANELKSHLIENNLKKVSEIECIVSRINEPGNAHNRKFTVWCKIELNYNTQCPTCGKKGYICGCPASVLNI